MQINYSYTNKIIKSIALIIDVIGMFIFSLFKKNKIANVKIKKIIIFKLDNIGDCFIMSPLFTELKRINNGVIIDVVCKPSTKEIFENTVGVSNVYSFNSFGFKYLLEVVKLVRSNKYDVFIDARGYAKVAIIGFLSGIKIRIGFLEEAISFFYGYRIMPPTGRHESYKYKRLLELFGIVSDFEWKPKLEVKDATTSYLKNFSGKILAIHPGASLPYKIWPKERWIDLLKKIIEFNANIEIAILGSQDEFSNAEYLKDNLGQGKIINLCGRMSIVENYSFISNCSFFIGSDSALGHFSGSFEIPTIILMNCVISKQRWQPLGDFVSVIQGKDNYHKCLYNDCKPPCPNMLKIDFNDVFDKFINNYNLCRKN